MDFWLLTSTTYGTWLPGDRRGFVSNVRASAGPRVRHNKPTTPFDADMPGLTSAAQNALKGPPVRLISDQANTLAEQFHSTAAVREWRISTLAIMANHFHLVLAADESYSGSDLLRDLKGFGSRALTQQYGRPRGGTWWTSSGSKRRLFDQRSVDAANRYVLEQSFPLLIWRNDQF